VSRYIIALIILLGLTATAPAQDNWPSHTITIVCPYAAGTVPDTIARTVGDQLSTRLKQPVIVENRTGAGGEVGTEYAAHAGNDGYTLLLGSFDTQAILGHVYKNMTDPVTAFAPISLLARIYNVVAATPDLDISTMADLASDKGKKHPITFATPGVGTNLHLLGEMIKLRTGADLVHVPYRSSPDGVADVMAGRVNLAIMGLPLLAPLIKDGKLKAVAITAPHRIDAVPDIPTMAEQGYQDLTVTGWFGLLAPAGTSAEIVNRLNAEARDIVKSDAYRKRLEPLLIEPASTSPQEFGAFIKSESDRMGKVVEQAHITAK
jgi:tripartite-type tricarboxylate transporter receptor subunit TctC